MVWCTGLLAAAGIGLSQEMALYRAKTFVLGDLQKWVQEKPESVADIQQLGQRFLIGYKDPSAIEPLVSQGLIGGIFVTRRNAQGKSFEQLRQEISDLQALRRKAGLPALIVATDQEGGAVSRLSPPLPYLDGLSSLAERFSVPGEQERQIHRAYLQGAAQGSELAALGITVNFSPVLDLKTVRPGNPFDFHSRINQRAISDDPETVSRISLAYAQGLQEQSVYPTLKHFPGLGQVREDTHHFSARLGLPKEELASRDWRPFVYLMERTRAFLMLGHVILSELDDDYPVSLSRTVVQDVLRNELGFQGVLLTDDLTMRAAFRYGICRASVEALNAGVDLLLIAYDVEKYYEAMYCAVKARQAGLLDLTLQEQSAMRLADVAGRNLF